MVEGHLREQVMGDMGVGDTMEHVIQELAKGAVDGAKGSTLEVPDSLTVVRHLGVGVLQEGDQDQPKVDKEVRDTIVLGNGQERGLDRGIDDTSQGQDDTKVREDDIDKVARLKDRRPGVEMRSPATIVLTRGIRDKICWPAKQELNDQPEQCDNGSFLIQMSHINLLLLNSGGGSLGWQANLATGLGDKDLILGHMASCLVMLRVRDSPRVVRDQQERVQDPADSVVKSLGGREGLMSALVSENPDTSADNALKNPVDRPSNVAQEGVVELVDLSRSQEQE